MYFFFFNDTATTEIYTLSLHDALPICSTFLCAAKRPTYRSRLSCGSEPRRSAIAAARSRSRGNRRSEMRSSGRSEEHTSELQSRQYLVCRLLLEKKKKRPTHTSYILPR